MTTLLSFLVAGLTLILAEIFLPGMIAGICGVICLLIAAAIGYSDYGTAIGTYILVGEVVVCVSTFLLWVKFFPKSKFGKSFILGEGASQRSAPKAYETLIGAEGHTLSSLHPTGVAEINDKRYDVVSEGRSIETGQPIKVVKVEGFRIVVRSSPPQVNKEQ